MKRGEYLFVYGTLRSSFGSEILNKIKDNILFAGKGYVKGKMFDIGEYPGFMEAKGNVNRIQGEVYLISREIEKVLKILDEYEGYNESDIERSEYIRKRKYIILERGNKKVISWIYVYKNGTNKDLKEIKSGDYLQYVTKSTRHNR